MPKNLISPDGVILLAAGMGKRMRSTLPKVLHDVGGQPLIFHILDQIQEVAPTAAIAIVVGHGRELVEETIRAATKFKLLDLAFVHQSEQRGTGHAARCAMDSKWGEQRIKDKAQILVLPADSPLIPSTLIGQMLSPMAKSAALRLLTCEIPDPTGYGRIVRRGKTGPVLRIVEEKDANVREKAICEVGASIYTFQASFLRFGLQRLQNKNAQGEFYLTDLIGQAVGSKKKIDVLAWRNSDDVKGVNDPWELAEARCTSNERRIRNWAMKGVKFVHPWSTSVDVSVELEEDVTIFPGAILMGATRVRRDAIIGPRVLLKNVQVAEGANIKVGTVAEDSVIGARAQVGPYAHLRPESKVGAETKIGNFVELKKSNIGDRTSIAHLSYVGDAEVGKDVNIGCGFVTCNFDGRVIDGARKHRTIIEDHVFLGSDCQTVAPVKIGKGAYVASGSTITEDVEPEALAIARARQVNKPGYARKFKSGGR